MLEIITGFVIVVVFIDWLIIRTPREPFEGLRVAEALQ